MDNVCHTLVGAAIGEAGLKGRTRFGNPALMIAANLPDIDGVAEAMGLGHRRRELAELEGSRPGDHRLVGLAAIFRRLASPPIPPV